MRFSPLLRLAGPLMLLGLGIVLFLPGGESPVDRAATLAPAVEADEAAVPAASPTLLAPVTFDAVEIASIEDAGAEPGADSQPDTEATASLASEPAETDPDQPMPPALAARDGTLAHVGGTAVNMRAGPSKDTARLMTLQPGDPVSIKEMSDNWAFVVTAGGEAGWVYSTYLRDRSEPAAAALEDEAPERAKPRKKDALTAQVRGSVAVRARPSSMSQRLFVIEPGEEITIVETRGRWARVVVDGGISGWVRLRTAE